MGDIAEIEAATGDERPRLDNARRGDEPPAELSFAVNGNNYLFSARDVLSGKQIPHRPADRDGRSATAAARRRLTCIAAWTIYLLPLARKFDKVIAVEESKAST